MAGDIGLDKSSEAESAPPGASEAAGTSRSVFYASHDSDSANSICQFPESHGSVVPAGARSDFSALTGGERHREFPGQGTFRTPFQLTGSQVHRWGRAFVCAARPLQRLGAALLASYSEAAGWPPRSLGGLSGVCRREISLP